MQVYNDELKHVGVLGMKWGKRSGPSTKDMRVTRKKIQQEELKNADNKHGVSEKRKAVLEFGYKNKLNYDGGGGSPIAGRKYTKSMNEINKLETKARNEAGQKTANRMLQKYGKDGIKKLNRSDNIRTAAGMAAVIALPAAVLTATIISDLR